MECCLQTIRWRDFIVLSIFILIMIQNVINRLFPLKAIYYRLSDLPTDSSSVIKNSQTICLSFETSCQSRRFCYIDFSELRNLFEETIESERSLYEVIPLSKPVKLYIDFEYLISFNHEITDHLIGFKSVLKIMYSIFYAIDISVKTYGEVFNAVCQKFLVLTA